MITRTLSALLLVTSIATTVAQSSRSDDLWDISQGAIVTASSSIYPGYSATAMFGDTGPLSDWTYFADNQPPGTVHFVDWTTPGDVTIGQVRLFAFGDNFLNNSREFEQFTLKAKSPGSLDYDITILTFTPGHPYTLLDPSSALILNQSVTPVTSRSFRAEFVQYTAGFGFDGPRIVELDGLPLPPPTIQSQPQNTVLNFAMPALFSVQATGVGTLKYQWFKDGVPISGQTTHSLRIASATANDVGAYTVSVTDSQGTTMSAAATLLIDTLNVQQSFADLWDVRSGITITDHSPLHPISATAEGVFGGITAGDDGSWTYFADNQPTGTVHHVEWTTPAPVSVRTIRLFAHGDPFLDHSREFDSITLKAKSPGSSTFNINLGTFIPTRPYTFLDNDLILDAEIPPIQASAFRAEFLQYTAGHGFDGPRIVELDAFSTRPLVRATIVTHPESKTVSKNSTVTFQVLARGGSVSYQWKFMGQNIPGATTDTFQIKSAKQTQQGYYSVVVSNPAGSVESAQTLLLVTK